MSTHINLKKISRIINTRKFIKKIKPEYLLFVIIFLHLFVLSRVVYFPYPELFIYSYLTEQGLIPYKEILDQHFPGIMFFPLNLASLGLANIYGSRVLHLSIVGVSQVLMFFTGNKLFKDKRWALAGTALYFIWQPYFEGYVLWIDSFVPVLLLASFYLLLNRKRNNLKAIFFAGLLVGVAILFKQVAIPLAVTIAVTLYFSDKFTINLRNYVLGVLLPIVILVFWVSFNGIWADFIYWTGTFNLTTFAEMGRKIPTFAGIIKTAPLFILPFAFFVLNRILNLKKNILLLVFFVGSCIFAYARFDFIHLQPALPFAVLITISLIIKMSKKQIFTLSLVYFAFILFLLIPFYRFVWGQGVLFFGDFERNISEKVLKYSAKGDTVFALGTTPHLYYLTRTIPPGKIFVFQFPWFMKEVQERVLSGIINDPPKVVVRDLDAKTGELRLIDYMGSINDYVNENYRVIDRVDGTEIMITK